MVSQLDDRVIFGSEDGFATMQGRNETCQGQLWYEKTFYNYCSCNIIGFIFSITSCNNRLTCYLKVHK